MYVWGLCVCLVGLVFWLCVLSFFYGSTIALVRDPEKVNSAAGKVMYGQYFEGAEVGESSLLIEKLLWLILLSVVFEMNV